MPNNNADILTYLVTPASLARIIEQQYNSGQMIVEFMMLDAYGGLSTQNVSGLNAYSDGRLMVTRPSLYSVNSIALHVKDNKDGGSDYVTSFTSFDW